MKACMMLSQQSLRMASSTHTSEVVSSKTVLAQSIYSRNFSSTVARRDKNLHEAFLVVKNIKNKQAPLITFS